MKCVVGKCSVTYSLKFVSYCCENPTVGDNVIKLYGSRDGEDYGGLKHWGAFCCVCKSQCIVKVNPPLEFFFLRTSKLSHDTIGLAVDILSHALLSMRQKMWLASFEGVKFHDPFSCSSTLYLRNGYKKEESNEVNNGVAPCRACRGVTNVYAQRS